MNINKVSKQITSTIVHRRKVKDTRNLLKENNYWKHRPAIHVNQKDI